MFQGRLEAAAFDPQDLHGLRGRINAETGGAFAFRKELRPHYRKAWRDIGLGYAPLALIVAGAGTPGSAAIPAGAALIGSTVVYLQIVHP